jgi:chromosome segregation ATPase
VYKFQIKTLKELIEAKENEFQSLIKENTKLKGEVAKAKTAGDADNKSRSEFLSPRSELTALDDKTRERIEGYKKTIEAYKQDQNVFVQQMQMLKADIKTYKSKYDNILSYDGRIQNYNDLKAVFLDLIEKYKPKYLDKITIRKDNEKAIVNKLLAHFQADKK